MTVRKTAGPAPAEPQPSASRPTNLNDQAARESEDSAPTATSGLVNETNAAALSEWSLRNSANVDQGFLNRFWDKMTQQQKQSALQTRVAEHQKRPIVQPHEELPPARESQPGPASALLSSECERPTSQHRLVPATNPDPSASASARTALPSSPSPSGAATQVSAKKCLNGLTFLYADFWDSIESESICRYVQHHGGKIADTFDDEISYVIIGQYQVSDILQPMLRAAIDELKLKAIDIYTLDELMCQMTADGGTTTVDASVSASPAGAPEVAEQHAARILSNVVTRSTTAGAMQFYETGTTAPFGRQVSHQMQLMLLEIMSKHALVRARKESPEIVARPQAAREQVRAAKRQKGEASPFRLRTPEENPHSADDPPSEEEPAPDAHLISAALLIPGRGPPQRHVFLIHSPSTGTITHLYPLLRLPPSYRHLPLTAVRTLMPGMWDCHVHLIGGTNLKFSEQITTSPATAGARLAKSCHDILMSGFTSVRDLGGYAPEVAKAVDEGSILGPNIYSAGAAISQTAGHGDLFELPVGWVWGRCGVGRGGNGDEVACRPLCIADGVDEVRKAVRLQIRRGAQVIKVLASGGVLSRDDDPMFQQFSDEELKVIVGEANRFNRSVAAHVHGKAGILAAIKAGCATLEHGTYLDDECVDAMLEKDVMFISTRTIVVEALKNRELMSPESYEKLVETAKWHKAAYALAIRRGVRCALGTDLALSVPGEKGSGLNLGRSGGEVKHAVEAGMSVLGAIEAVTANGPATLGKMAPRKGRVEVGWDADLIGVDGDVLGNVGVLAEVERISHVWKGGVLVKEPKGPRKA